MQLLRMTSLRITTRYFKGIRINTSASRVTVQQAILNNSINIMILLITHNHNMSNHIKTSYMLHLYTMTRLITIARILVSRTNTNGINSILMIRITIIRTTHRTGTVRFLSRNHQAQHRVMLRQDTDDSQQNQNHAQFGRALNLS